MLKLLNLFSLLYYIVIYKNKLLNTMNIISYIWKHMIFYRLYDCIYKGYLYFNDKKTIGKFLHDNSFKMIIDHYLNTNLKYNTITGEPYCVVNPNTKADGTLDTDSIVIEIDGYNTNTNDYVEVWFYKRMKLVGDLFKIHNLYDYINIVKEKVGPDILDNHLIIFKIASKSEYTTAIKKVIYHLFILGGLSIITILCVTQFF